MTQQRVCQLGNGRLLGHGLTTKGWDRSFGASNFSSRGRTLHSKFLYQTVLMRRRNPAEVLQARRPKGTLATVSAQTQPKRWPEDDLWMIARK